MLKDFNNNSAIQLESWIKKPVWKTCSACESKIHNVDASTNETHKKAQTRNPSALHLSRHVGLHLATNAKTWWARVPELVRGSMEGGLPRHRMHGKAPCTKIRCDPELAHHLRNHISVNPMSGHYFKDYPALLIRIAPDDEDEALPGGVCSSKGGGGVEPRITW